MMTLVKNPFLISYMLFTSVCFAETKHLSNDPIELDITTHLGDRQTFKQGDVISFMVSLDKNAYLSLIYQDASGDLIQILPNKLSSHHFYKAGLFLAIPNSEQPFRFTVSPPYGEETLWGFASSKPLPTLTGQPRPNGFVFVGKDISSILTLFRSHQEGIRYGEATTRLTTIEDQPD